MKHSFIEVAALTDKLLQQQKTKIIEKLKCKPDCPTLEWKLAELLRRCGELSEALTFYRRVSRDNPHYDKASRLIALLSGQCVHATRFHGPEHPTPYVYLKNFLTPELCDSLWQFVLQKQGLFKAALMRTESKGDIVDPHYLNSLRFPAGVLKDINVWFLPLIAKAVEKSCAKLGYERFSPAKFELALASYSEGNFHRLHQDVGPGELATRTLTASYCFYNRPKSFSGGDILLHDTDISNKKPLGSYTRITPECNSLLIFPSRFFHQITPVLGPKALEQNRFTLISWVH